MAKRIVAIDALIAVLASAFLGMSFRSYMESLEKEKEELISLYQSISDIESEWIISLQLEDGAVLLYEPSHEGSGHINPYFACQSMLGLISDPTPGNISAVGKYLNWHTSRILESDGMVTDFRLEAGNEISTEKADSFDSYAAEYILLLAEYIKKGGDLNTIGDWSNALLILADAFDLVILNDVTYVNEDMRIAYLMDNSEVYEASEKISYILLHDKRFHSQKELQSIAKKYSDLSKMLKTSINNLFYLEDSLDYTIGIKKDGSIYGKPDMSEFYPDSVAQLFPVMTGAADINDRERALYYRVCKHHDWENGNLDTTFEWSVMSFAAASFNDFERVDIYLNYYSDNVAANRSYPSHTANAGWVMRTCNKMIDHIEDEYKFNFFSFIKWIVGEMR